jgi:hypothetical protein
LLGNGDGTFQAAVPYTSASPLSVAVADFNGDGIPDLAVANLSSSGTVSILLGKGDGTFHTARAYAAGVKTASVAIGDFNGDGIPDLAVANGGPGGHGSNQGGGDTAVLLGNGDGTFRAAVHYAAGASPNSVNVADFNGDGTPDLVVANFFSADISVLLGKGDGTFQAAVSYAVGPYPQDPSSVVVKDFNGDGILDVAVAFAGGVRVLLGNGDGTFQTSPISYLAGGFGDINFTPCLAVADFNGDGFPDLAVTSGAFNNIVILINEGKWAP